MAGWRSCALAGRPTAARSWSARYRHGRVHLGAPRHRGRRLRRPDCSTRPCRGDIALVAAGRPADRFRGLARGGTDGRSSPMPTGRTSGGRRSDPTSADGGKVWSRRAGSVPEREEPRLHEWHRLAGQHRRHRRGRCPDRCASAEARPGVGRRALPSWSPDGSRLAVVHDAGRRAPSRRSSTRTDRATGSSGRRAVLLRSGAGPRAHLGARWQVAGHLRAPPASVPRGVGPLGPAKAWSVDADTGAQTEIETPVHSWQRLAP